MQPTWSLSKQLHEIKWKCICFMRHAIKKPIRHTCLPKRYSILHCMLVILRCSLCYNWSSPFLTHMILSHDTRVCVLFLKPGYFPKPHYNYLYVLVRGTKGKGQHTGALGHRGKPLYLKISWPEVKSTWLGGDNRLTEHSLRSSIVYIFFF